MNRILPALIVLVLATMPVQAKQSFNSTGSVNCDQRYLFTCDVRGFNTNKKATHRRERHTNAKRTAHQMQKTVRLVRTAREASDEAYQQVTEILPHPNGCPRRAFCGCGAALKVFGSPIRALWLAANWFRYPHADPAPGMVAVRRHHVFVIEHVINRSTVIAYDANSGRHLTRRHVRSLAGYSIRNPHGRPS